MTACTSLPVLATEMTLGQLLGTVLLEHGIDQLFCIPGDFTMQLSRELNATSGLTLRTMSHEYGTTLAAFGYAVAKARPGAVCFTYGVGVLNACNAIAQAYVERVPMVVISGAPGKRESEAEIFLHHTIVDDGSQLRIMREVTASQTRIDDVESGLVQIREAIRTAIDQSRPVYIEIPRDLYSSRVMYQPRGVSSETSVREFSSEAWQVANEAVELLKRSKRPVCIPGLEVRRFGLSSLAQEVIESLELPWVASPISRNVLDPTHPLCRGVFAGPASPMRGTRTLIETCDTMLLLGEPNSDVNMGVAGKVPRDGLVAVYDGQLVIGSRRFAVSTRDFLLAMHEAAKSWKNEGRPAWATPDDLVKIAKTEVETESGQLTPFGVLAEMNRCFDQHPSTVLVADCGDAFFMSLGMHPRDVLTSSLYMSMGIGVPGAIGHELGGGGRPIALVGDGAFQMTGMELMHARRFGVKPIVVVLNNRRWISLSSDERDKHLTAIEAMDFSNLGLSFNVKTRKAVTVEQLRQCLEEAMELDEPVLIDAQVGGSARSYLCERFFDGIKSQYHLATA